MQTLAGVFWTVALAGAAEPGPPVKIWKGELTEWNVRGISGDFAILEKSTIHRCKITPQTYLTRETLRVTPIGVRAGDFVEVVADMREEGRCTALTVYIKPLERSAKQAALSPRLSMPSPGFLDNLFPRGLITLTGIVEEVGEDRVVLWTRGQRKMSFILRPDTIFSDSGVPVGAKALAPQTRVFLRAGRSFEGDLEAYQIVWGEILFPNRSGQ
jgi:hypothetical protein